MAKFDVKTMYNFENYLRLQHSGEVNMVSSAARDKLGISKEEHRFILDNYNDLLQEYNELKVVDEIIDDAKQRVHDGGKGEKEMGFKRTPKTQEEKSDG